MNKYEVLYIISQDVADDAREAMINNFADTVVKNGGTVDNIDKIGLKKFAYEIDGKREGFYVLMNFTADSNVPRLIEQKMSITDGFVRKMFIKK